MKMTTAVGALRFGRVLVLLLWEAEALNEIYVAVFVVFIR